MMYRKILFLLLFCLNLVAVCGAQEGKQVLLFPIVLQGDYHPHSDEAFAQALHEQAQKMGSKSTVIAARPADLAGLQYDGTARPPSLDEAARLCAAYGTTHAVWLSLRFSPELTPGKPSILTVAVAARMWAFKAATGKVVVDEPVVASRSASVGDSPQDAQLKTQAAQMSSQCINQLAQQIIAISRQGANQSLVKAWSKPGSQSQAPAVSANYKKMVEALQGYQKAMDAENLIDTVDFQRRTSSAWYRLTYDEQRAIERDYPGTYEWMNSGMRYYDVGDPWYPGRR